jgi:hypothetical protein
LRIDHTHKNWLAASLLIFGASMLLYAIYRVPPSGVPMGGTALGLGFGSLGFAFMIFAALLGARKKVPVWRVGRAQTWMRGHLWLGLLSLPLIVFHSGFRYGHGLSAMLMTLLIFVVASGVFGAALQHFMPRVMTREVTMETIYEEIEHVRAQLREEAEELFTQATAETAKAAAAGVIGATATSVAVREEEAAPFRNFFEQELKPFLESPGGRGHALAGQAQSRSAFVQLRTLVPPALHATLEDLESICEEERQLTMQARLHLWLHGWLLLHVPLSLALILRGAVHAVMALRF